MKNFALPKDSLLRKVTIQPLQACIAVLFVLAVLTGTEPTPDGVAAETNDTAQAVASQVKEELTAVAMEALAKAGVVTSDVEVVYDFDSLTFDIDVVTDDGSEFTISGNLAQNHAEVWSHFDDPTVDRQAVVASFMDSL